MRVAITAASGKLGSAVVAATAAKIGPENVVAVARTPAKARHMGVEVRAGSYDNRAELDAAFIGIDRVLLVSGMDPPDQRIGQHRSVIAAARSNGVQKMVYTSIQGPEAGTAFSPIVQSNRQTEEDVKESGMAWAIGRNGIYIEPDVEYVDTYVKDGEIVNCAAGGRCGYTTRTELAHAYATLLAATADDNRIFDLSGAPITQAELATYLGRAFGAEIAYRSMSFDDYLVDRIDELGEFIGTVVAGIYQGIREGAYDTKGDFEAAAGRPHQSWDDYFSALGAG